MAMQIDLFYAPHCSACGRIRPRLRRLASRHRGRIIVRELNVLDSLEQAVAAGVICTPALVVEGRVRLAGKVTEAAFEALVKELKLEEEK